MALTKRQETQRDELKRQLGLLLKKKYDPKDDARIRELRDLLKMYDKN